MNDFVAGAPSDRLPTLVRVSTGYRVFDPNLVNGTNYVVDDAGDLVYTRVPAGAMTGTGFLASVVVGITLGDNEWGQSFLVFLASLPVAAALIITTLSLIYAVTDPARAYKRQFGHSRFVLDITDRSSEHWQLCARAERLAATRSWQSGRIDPTRTLGGLLWTAVGGGEGWAAEALTNLAEPATGPDLTAV